MGGRWAESSADWKVFSRVASMVARTVDPKALSSVAQSDASTAVKLEHTMVAHSAEKMALSKADLMACC